MADVLFIEYPKCSTCKKAKAWLDAHGVAYADRHIVEDNPTSDELAACPPAFAPATRKPPRPSPSRLRACISSSRTSTKRRAIPMTMISRVCAKLSKRRASMAKPASLPGIGFHAALRLSDAGVVAR